MPIKIGIATNPFRESFQQAFEQGIEIVPPKSSLEKIHEYDLIIFSGGADIDTRIYGEPITYSRGINYERDKIELDILSKALALNVKVFGVCRGHQLINAKLGGRMVQDLFMGQKPSLHHSSPHKIEKVSSDAFLKEINIVNSLHHQGVTKAGMGLQVTSVHKKIIESTMGKNIYSVQFHPEFMLESKVVRDFFSYFKSYVESNVEKKDFSKVKSHEIDNNFFGSRPKTRNVVMREPSFELGIRASRNIEQFLNIIRSNSNIRETSIGLQMIPEHATRIENLYTRKELLLDAMDDLNGRDEEIYERMEQGEYDSDDEYGEMENERDTLGTSLSNHLQELDSIKNQIMNYAVEIRDTINNDHSLSEDSEEVPPPLEVAFPPDVSFSSTTNSSVGLGGTFTRVSENESSSLDMSEFEIS